MRVITRVWHIVVKIVIARLPSNTARKLREHMLKFLQRAFHQTYKIETVKLSMRWGFNV